ncbi:MAG TPA: alpha/beta hydrolase [Solirubrobacteraceae bacterium]|jgi:pimeloyl-ACP methyl ester carboxylesterase
MPNLHTTDGTTLFYRDWGTGDPMVFVHGWGLNSDMWEYQLPDLVDRGLRCVAYDRRGCGRSDQPGDGFDFDTLADDLAALIEHLDLRDVTLVSHSMGSGEVARYLTRHGGDRVDRVALISPTLPYLRLDASNPEGVDPAAFEQIIAALRADRPGYLTNVAAAAIGADLPGVEVSDALIDWGIGLFLSASPKASIDTVRTHTDTDLRDDMASFTMPTLIVHGDHDALVPIEVSARRAAPMIAGCELVVYENASHWPFVTHRERLSDDLAAFARAGAMVGS